jgi:hypothetical protein
MGRPSSKARDHGRAAWRAGDRRNLARCAPRALTFRIKKTSFRIATLQGGRGEVILPDGRSRFHIQKSSDQVIDFIGVYF